MDRRWLLLPHLQADFPLPLDAPFTTAQAIGAGLTARHLRALVAAGLLCQPVRGAYDVAAQRAPQPPGHRDLPPGGKGAAPQQALGRWGTHLPHGRHGDRIESGLPTPEPQLEVHSRGRLAVIDVACGRVRFGAEYLGREWHSSDEQVEHDEQRLAWLDEDEGWVMEPFWAEDIYGRSPSAYVTLRRRYAEARRRTMRRAA